VIDVQNLTKTYQTKTAAGAVHAVRAISFAVAPGEVFGLLGPNGAGKSTTIGMLTTTIEPTAGRASLAGYDVATEPIAARQASAVVFQDPAVDLGLSGRRNLAVHAQLWGLDPVTADLRIADVADAFGLDDLIERDVSTYSGGQRRRLEIARALLSRPQVLFLDEPTVGLDPRIRFELLDVIAGLRDRGDMTILLTTHYLDEAERLCDRIAIMHRGDIVALDSPTALLAALGREVLEVRVRGSADATLRRLQQLGLAGADAFSIGTTVTVPLHDSDARTAAGRVVDARVEHVALNTRAPNLDDVYLRLTGSSLAA
jgi:ABC-2 type transport system ATP-binding protein